MRGTVTNIYALAAANAQRWASAKPTQNFTSIARRLIAPDAQSRYRAVSAKTGVPWPVIAVIHERECSQDWTRSLSQGDPWDRVSVHVPSGRGPFQSWEDAAVDALENCAPYAGGNRDWSIGALLTVLEEYNGLGYAARGVSSPYLWAGREQCRSGEYVRGGVYGPNVIDSQPGGAGLLMTMRDLDPSIAFPVAPIKPIVPQAPATAAAKGLASRPSIKSPARGSIGAWVASLLRSE